MGPFKAIRFAAAVDTIAAAPLKPALGSPWSNADALIPVVIEDVFGLKLVPVTRGEAMRVPAMARARNLLCVLVGRMPLRGYTATDTPLDPQPAWINATDQAQTGYARMVWTTDDLLFHGAALWEVTARDARGFPLRMAHVPWDDWEVDADARVTLNGVALADSDYVYFESFVEGILDTGARAIRMAAGLDRAALDTARAPFKLELHNESDVDLLPEEVAGLVGEARQALADNMGVLYTNRSLNAIVHEVSADQMLTEGRNASAIDMARLAGVPAATVDAVLSGSGITYQTGPMLNRALVDYGAAGFMSAISARLSQDDVTPHGQRVAFELEPFLGPLPGAAPTGTGQPAPAADYTQDYGGPL